MEGEHILLREERLEDMPNFAALQNDLDTQGWGKTLPPDYTENMYIKRFEGREFSFDPKEGRFVIVSKESGKFAGMISYSGLRPRWSVIIGIIMDKKYWGTGFAFDAQDVLLKFLFLELGLQVVLRRGGVYDTLVMDLLREEYFAKHLDFEDTLLSLV